MTSIDEDTRPRDMIHSAVENNARDIREVRQKVSTLETQVTDIKLAQQMTNQTLEFFTSSMTEVKQKLDMNNTTANTKMDKIIQTANDNQAEQLKEYKSAITKVVIAVVAAGIIGALSFFFTV